jgi:hypothetical protein
MPKPILTGCGTEDTPPCPPQPAIIIKGVRYWSEDQIKEHGKACYLKGITDSIANGGN